MILLPHHHEFAETLANLPRFYRNIANETCETTHFLQKNPNYVPEMANDNRLKEYLLSGEIDEFVEYIDGYADELTEEGEDWSESWELSDEWLGSI